MGFPVDTRNPDPPGGLRLTRSYLHTGYVLAALRHARTLASLAPGTVVSVGSSTVPNFYLVGALGPARPLGSDVYLSQEDALDALVERRDAVAMVWAPSVVRYRARHAAGPPIVVTTLPIPHARWGVAALYAAAHATFAQRFNVALIKLRGDGTLTHIRTTAGLEDL
jgi:ABC-type amino acid transport substrate-binding protein